MLEMLSFVVIRLGGANGMLLCNVVELVSMQELMVPKRAGRVRWNFGIGQLNHFTCKTELEGMKECPNTLCWVDVGMLCFL